MILQGWTHTSIEQLQPYQQRKDQSTLQDGCVLLGNRVVVPVAGQAKVIKELHQDHSGITRMKGLPGQKFCVVASHEQTVRRKG